MRSTETAGQEREPEVCVPSRLNIVVAHALRRGLDPEVNPEAAARELAQLAQQRRWVLEHARAVITRRVVERPSPVGEQARELLDRALTLATERAAARDAAGPAAIDPSVLPSGARAIASHGLPGAPAGVVGVSAARRLAR